MPYNTEKIRHAYKSKHNSFLFITDGGKMALSCCKKWSPLLKGITSNHDGEFFCLNCFHSYTSRNKVKKTWKCI